MTAVALPRSIAATLLELPIDIRRALEGLWSSLAGARPARSAPRDPRAIVQQWEREASAENETRAALREFDGAEFRPATDHEIGERAHRLAWLHKRARAMWAASHRSSDAAATGHDVKWLSPYLELGLFPPHLKPSAIARRVTCWRFWRRVLRRKVTTGCEHGMRARGLVRRRRAVYVSEWAARLYAARKQRSRRTLEASIAVSEEGEQLSLFDVAQSTISNPRIRRGELMCRARGLEDIAREQGHAAVFVTATTPSRFHPQLEAAGANPRYDGASVREAQAWLCDKWARSRAKLQRLSIAFYGVRVAEPHHDGTPHWHVLLFVPAQHLDTLQSVLRGYWLSDGGDDPGADERRVTFKRINLHDVDPLTGELKRSPATGYLAKYIAKNIDGHKVGDDLEAGEPADTSSERVQAWASTHRIRQFQQLGAAPVGVWRELRRIREPVTDEAIERARAAADAGDFGAFVRAAAGVWLLKRPHEWLFNRYGEPRPLRTVGVQSASSSVRTRVKRWRIIFRDALAALLSPLGPVSITVRAGSAGTHFVNGAAHAASSSEEGNALYG